VFVRLSVGVGAVVVGLEEVAGEGGREGREENMGTCALRKRSGKHHSPPSLPPYLPPHAQRRQAVRLKHQGVGPVLLPLQDIGRQGVTGGVAGRREGGRGGRDQWI